MPRLAHLLVTGTYDSWDSPFTITVCMPASFPPSLTHLAMRSCQTEWIAPSVAALAAASQLVHLDTGFVEEESAELPAGMFDRLTRLTHLSLFIPHGRSWQGLGPLPALAALDLSRMPRLRHLALLNTSELRYPPRGLS
ncbi:hypothetical protein ABPG75_000317 [Micractinium tetrahymenae]